MKILRPTSDPHLDVFTVEELRLDHPTYLHPDFDRQFCKDDQH